MPLSKNNSHSRSFLQSTISITLIQKRTRTSGIDTPNSVQSSSLNPSPVLDTTNSSVLTVSEKRSSSRSSKRQNNRVSPEGLRRCSQALGRVRSHSGRAVLLSNGVVPRRSLWVLSIVLFLTKRVLIQEPSPNVKRSAKGSVSPRAQVPSSLLPVAIPDHPDSVPAGVYRVQARTMDNEFRRAGEGHDRRHRAGGRR